MRLELSLNVIAKCENRAIIRFLNAEGITPVNINGQLTEVCGKSCMDVNIFTNLVRRLQLFVIKSMMTKGVEDH